MIKHLSIKYCYNFNCKLLKASFNQITTNKVLDIKSTNKVSYLNISTYNPTKTTATKSYNKTVITYNHLKGSKKAFNYKSYKSIKVVRFWLVDRLKGFERGINKIIRLKIYRWIDYKRGLVEIIVLISSFSWDRVWIELYLTNLLKIWQSTEIWGIFEPHFRMGNFIKDGASPEIWGDFQFHFRLRYLN